MTIRGLLWLRMEKGDQADWRRVKTLAFDEPTVEELAERGTHAVRSGRLLLDEVSQGLVGCLGASVHGLRYLPWLAGERITAQVGTDFPHSVASLALGPTHASQRRHD